MYDYGVYHDDEWPWWVKLLIFGACVGVLGYCMKGCVDRVNSPEYKAEQARQEAVCRTPRLVATAEGVALYEVQPSCAERPVYFSKAGTTTSWQECHHSGKTRRCETRTSVTPNAGEHAF